MGLFKLCFALLLIYSKIMKGFSNLDWEETSNEDDVSGKLNI